MGVESVGISFFLCLVSVYMSADQPRTVTFQLLLFRNIFFSEAILVTNKHRDGVPGTACDLSALPSACLPTFETKVHPWCPFSSLLHSVSGTPSCVVCLVNGPQTGSRLPPHPS